MVFVQPPLPESAQPITVPVQALKYASAAPRPGLHALLIINVRRVSAGRNALAAARPAVSVLSTLTVVIVHALPVNRLELYALPTLTAI